MKRIISKFGAYTSHLVALSEESSTKAADRAKLKGYLKKWLDAKYLLGCAFFVDLLLPCSVFSKTMQSDEVDIVGISFMHTSHSNKIQHTVITKGMAAALAWGGGLQNLFAQLIGLDQPKLANCHHSCLGC